MKKHKRLSNVDEVRVVKVIEVKSLIGKGDEDDPGRQIVEYFFLDGKRIARTEWTDEVENIHEWSDE